MKRFPFVIGISGHQDLNDQPTRDFVAQQFREMLMLYRQQAPHIVLFSSLAVGCDPLFAHIALELGIPVEIVVPWAEPDVVFSTEEDRHAYSSLLQKCQQTHFLPDQSCSEDAFFAAEKWIVDHCDLMILIWNGLPACGKGSTADIAAYARLAVRPFIHINTVQHTVKHYGDISAPSPVAFHIAPKRTYVTTQQTIYQGPVLTVNQYHLRMPDGEDLVRDIVERPESVLVIPAGQDDSVLLIEEYDLGAGQWQLTLPGGKVEGAHTITLEEQAQRELRQEIGYKAGRLEKLIEFYGHPGYIFHRVHAFVASDLEWDPLELEKHEEIKVHTYTIKEALEATLDNNRCDPEAALILWLYAQKKRILTLAL